MTQFENSIPIYSNLHDYLYHIVFVKVNEFVHP